MIIDWAHPRLFPKIIDLRIMNQTRSAGESVTGFEQVVSGIQARWAFSFEFNNLKRVTIPAYRAMIASLGGRANALRVPVFDPQFWPTNAEIGIALVPHSDGTPFGDAGLYSTNDVSGITATGSAGVKSLDIDFGDYGEIFEAGLYFGIEDETYIAKTVTWEGTVATIGFEPGLRQAHTASIFRLRPRLIMRLAADDVGSHPLDRGIITAPSLELVEILPDELSLLEAGG